MAQIMGIDEFAKFDELEKRGRARILRGKEVKDEKGNSVTPVKILRRGWRDIVALVVVPAEEPAEMEAAS